MATTIGNKIYKLTADHHRPAGWTANICRDIVVEPYAWPGGYAKLAVMTDGGVLCPGCVAENYDSVYRSTMHNIDVCHNDGWGIAGIALVEEICDEETTFCDHCGRDVSEL